MDFKSFIPELPKTAIITDTHDVSYTELLQRVKHFAQFSPHEERALTIIFSENREGWIYAFYSVWENGGIPVPVDAACMAGDLAYIIGDCTPVAIWTSTSLRPVVEEALLKAGSKAQILIIDDHEAEEPSTEKANLTYKMTDTGVIIYTSGTTGSPKGVMLSFENMMSNIISVSRDVPIFNSERRTLVLLPLHHVLPLMGSLLAPIMCGGGVAIAASMSGPDIMGMLCKGKVGIIIGVPRLYTTIYAGVKKKIDSSPITRALFDLCASVGNRRLSRFIFSSVRKKMGGHLDYCVSGGAALDREVGEGLRTLGLDVLEGYGMTEFAPIIAFTRPWDIIPGCSGEPLPGMQVKSVNGELCAKGPNLMQGYYGKPKETAEVIDKEGFLHTGDLCRFDGKGRVYITGRTKEIIVLSNGKNVLPSGIESKLEKFSSMVKEVAVTYNNDMLCAIIVPQPAFAEGKTDEELATRLKREVLVPYNAKAENFLKVMNLIVWHDPLPRTRLDKIKRFKLQVIVRMAASAQTREEKPVEEPQTKEYQLLKRFIIEVKSVLPRPTDHLEADLAFDSLDRVSMQGFIEHTFGAEIEAQELSQFASLQALAEHIEKVKTTVDETHVDAKQVLCEDTMHLKLPHCTFLFPLAAKIVWSFLKIYNRLSINGKENIPQRGPYILTPNHQSFVDGGIVLGALTWMQTCHCYSFATEDHVRDAFTRFMADNSNIIIMERSNLKASIQKLAMVLKKGKSILVFPEGTRTYSGELGPFKQTFAILACELSVPVVPVCIRGAYEALPRGRHFLRPRKLMVDFLPPIMPTTDMTYDCLTDRVKTAIDAVLHS